MSPRSLLAGVLLVVLVAAILPHCAMPCGSGSNARGTLPHFAPECSMPCEHRMVALAAGAPAPALAVRVFSSSDALVRVPADLALEPPDTGLLAPVNMERAPSPPNLAIFLRDRSLLI